MVQEPVAVSLPFHKMQSMLREKNGILYRDAEVGVVGIAAN